MLTIRHALATIWRGLRGGWRRIVAGRTYDGEYPRISGSLLEREIERRGSALPRTRNRAYWNAIQGYIDGTPDAEALLTKLASDGKPTSLVEPLIRRAVVEAVLAYEAFRKGRDSGCECDPPAAPGRARRNPDSPCPDFWCHFEAARTRLERAARRSAHQFSVDQRLFQVRSAKLRSLLEASRLRLDPNCDIQKVVRGAQEHWPYEPVILEIAADEALKRKQYELARALCQRHLTETGDRRLRRRRLIHLAAATTELARRHAEDGDFETARQLLGEVLSRYLRPAVGSLRPSDDGSLSAEQRDLARWAAAVLRELARFNQGLAKQLGPGSEAMSLLRAAEEQLRGAAAYLESAGDGDDALEHRIAAVFLEAAETGIPRDAPSWVAERLPALDGGEANEEPNAADTAPIASLVAEVLRPFAVQPLRRPSSFRQLLHRSPLLPHLVPDLEATVAGLTSDPASAGRETPRRILIILPMDYFPSMTAGGRRGAQDAETPALAGALPPPSDAPAQTDSEQRSSGDSSANDDPTLRRLLGEPDGRPGLIDQARERVRRRFGVRCPGVLLDPDRREGLDFAVKDESRLVLAYSLKLDGARVDQEQIYGGPKTCLLPPEGISYASAASPNQTWPRVSLAQSDPGGRPLLGVKDYIEVICERLEWLLVSRLPELLSLDDAMLLANGERAISEDRATLLDWTRFLKALLRERIAVALPRGLTGVFLRVEEQGLDHFERVERSRGHPQVLPLLWGRQPTALTLTLSHAAEDRLTRRLDGGWRLECSVSESNRILRELREIAEEGFTVRLVVRDSRHRQALAAFLYSRRVPMPVLTVAEVADWMDLGETRALELAGLAR